MNKKFKCIFILVILVCPLFFVSFVANRTSYTFYYDDREITIESSHISEEDARSIADCIAYGTMSPTLTTHGVTLRTPLLCTLFGHSLKTTTAVETVHNAYSTSPKCLLNRYEVVTCTRESCDYIQTTLVSSTRISYCHG